MHLLLSVSRGTRFKLCRWYYFMLQPRIPSLFVLVIFQFCMKFEYRRGSQPSTEMGTIRSAAGPHHAKERKISPPLELVYDYITAFSTSSGTAAFPPMAFTDRGFTSSMYSAALSVLFLFTSISGAPLPSPVRPARTPPVSPSGKSSRRVRAWRLADPGGGRGAGAGPPGLLGRGSGADPADGG